MRLLLTAVVGNQPHDIAVDADDDASVGDLAAALATAFPTSAAPVAGERPALRVVAGGGDAATQQRRADGIPASVPALHLGSRALDGNEPLSMSLVRHGAVVGVGAPVADPLAEPTGLVEVRVASGPGAGAVVRLDPGEYAVGPGPACDLVVSGGGLPADVAVRLAVRVTGEVVVTPDPAVIGATGGTPGRTRTLDGPIVLPSRTEPEPEPKRRKNAKGALPDNTETVDPDLPAPLVHLQRYPLTEAATWEPGQALVVGDSLLALAVPTAPDASLSPTPTGATLDYNRPPRLLPPARTTDFTLPNEPRKPDRTPVPILMVLLPVVMGVAMYLWTKSPWSLMFIAMSPLMAIGNFSTTRRQNKRRYADELAEFSRRTLKVQDDAMTALAEERTARRRDFADPGELLVTAVGPRTRLWERRVSDPDWLVARVGTADQPSDVHVTSPDREQHEGAMAWTAPDVPVTVPLAEVGVTGVAGPLDQRMALARWLVGQTCVLQSPDDVEVVLFTDASAPGAADQWNWVRWLPHVRSDADDTELAHVGVDDMSTSRRISELLAELERRTAKPKDGAAAPPPARPILVVLDGARNLRLLPGMVTLLQAGPPAGILFLCLDEDTRLLPEECLAVVNAAGAASTVAVTTRRTVEAVRLDLVTGQWAERVARAISPVRDVSDVDSSSSLPGSSRLLSVLSLDPVTSERVQQQWRSVGRTTQAVIGEGADGPFAIDIRRDGPHGLVAGTTGSGKSELLQTVIASLAVNNRPDEMNFVLVDYKGGAAFKDCNKLPHTVGMVTDLDGHLTTRALESLGAELRRREHQLARADAKDIEDYLAGHQPGDEPMPRLLIVIDEFAALVAELPDFVTGLVDIARRGRSLGVHLILATQRPAGVVSAEIKSNTNLRIALRVTDAGDSQDVIESGDAAQIAKSTPGRAYARLGHSSLIPFQSSRVGGRPRGVEARAAVALRPIEFAGLGTPLPEQAAVEEEGDISVPTDLAALVGAATAASADSGISAPPPPWLPALDEQVTIDDLLGQFPTATPSADNLVLPFGLADVPREQRRDVAAYDLARDGHLAVVGAPRSGRSTVLRALAGAVGRFLDPRDVHLYGVDCGNNALLPLVNLPHCGAVVTRDQTDRMDRLVAALQREISNRQQSLAVQGYADIAEQRAAAPEEERLPYILVLLDRWEAFFQAYDGLDGGRLVTAWQQILQEGAGVGVKLVVSGDRTLTTGRMSTLLEDKLMLRMVDAADFSTIGMTAKQVPGSMPDGRAFRAEGLLESQVVLLTDDAAGTAQVGELQRIAREAKERYAAVPAARRPFRVDVLPVRIGLAEALELGSEVGQHELPVGVGGDTLGLRSLDALRQGPALLVAGGRGTGRSTVLCTMAEFALQRGWQVVVFTPRISPLRDLAGRDGVHGPFDDSSDESDVTALLRSLESGPTPMLTLVDDVELFGADDWVPTLLAEHIAALRDTGSAFVGAGTPSEMASLYRGPVIALKRTKSGVLLSPQTQDEADILGVRLPRSAVGQTLPPGGGFIVKTGQAERIQVIWPS